MPKCGMMILTEIRQFNLMFKTFQVHRKYSVNTNIFVPKPVRDFFVNFKNVQRTKTRKRLPFASDSSGKSFPKRNHAGEFLYSYP